MEKHFNDQKYEYEYRLCSLLNFPRTVIYDGIWLLLLLRINIHLYATIGQPYDVINIQNGCT